MKIQIGSLEEGENEIEAVLSAGELGFGDEISARGPLGVSLSLYRQGKGIEIHGEARGVLVEECSRCLGPAERAISVAFTILADEQRRVPDEEVLQDEDSEIFFVHYQHGVMELAPMIREAILLDRPIRTLCSPDCRGLCPRCGANLNLEACRCGDRPVPGGKPAAE